MAFNFQGLVGQSEAMSAVFEKIRLFAGSIAPVYILGETGTGKEQVARAIHAASRRAQRPFVPVNVAALSDDLFESEFFGHVRGSFTGAVADREGYVVAAEGGTLLIDEVADLSPRAQIKLLRFLQDREYRRLGESRLRRADVRVLAATNSALEQRVGNGQFREDLLFRLNTLVLRLPPLRDRAGDVLSLARHFLRRAAEAEERPALQLSEGAARALEGYPWPGNVRELQAEMHRAVVVTTGRIVRAEDLSPRILAARPLPQGSLAHARDQFEREYVARTLEECGGHRMRAAQRLGLTRQGLSLTIRRLGLRDVERVARQAARAPGESASTGRAPARPRAGRDAATPSSTKERRLA